MQRCLATDPEYRQSIYSRLGCPYSPSLQRRVKPQHSTTQGVSLCRSGTPFYRLSLTSLGRCSTRTCSCLSSANRTQFSKTSSHGRHRAVPPRLLISSTTPYCAICRLFVRKQSITSSTRRPGYLAPSSPTVNLDYAP